MNDPDYPVHLCVHKHHSFFWRSRLPHARMQAISDWIGSLDADHRRMLDELKDDVRDQDAFDNAEAER